MFKDLSQRSLGFEVANHVLAHLTGSSQGDVDFTQQVNFTMSGYEFGTLYRRIRTIIPLEVCLVFKAYVSYLLESQHYRKIQMITIS